MSNLQRLAGAAVVISLLLAACSSAGSGTSATAPAASTSASGTGTGSPQTGASTSVTPAPPATTSPTAPADGTGQAACGTASLQLTVDASQADSGAGSTYYPLDFTNTSAASCELYGYPGVSFVTTAAGTGRQIGAAALRGTAFTKVAVTLAPGQTAHAWLKVAEAGNYPASSCQPATAGGLRVYPPGQTEAGYVSHRFSACSSGSAALLTVLPVRSGKGRQGITP
jgi:hypothetical protein